MSIYDHIPKKEKPKETEEEMIERIRSIGVPNTIKEDKKNNNKPSWLKKDN